MSDFNKPFPNMRELSEKDFAQSQFFTYCHGEPEYRQFPFKHSDGKTYTATARGYMVNGEGFCVIREYWQGRVRWFKYGCEHNYEEKNVGRCLHKYTCTKCKHSYTTDSSD